MGYAPPPIDRPGNDLAQTCMCVNEIGAEAADCQVGLHAMNPGHNDVARRVSICGP